MVLNPTRLDDVSTCRRCGALGQRHVPSWGLAERDLMVVGQSPGHQEVIEGRPFVGPSGDALTMMLTEAGISRSNVYLANVLKCNPPRNRAALDEERVNCWENWLKHEVKLVNPKLILVLGQDAWKTLLPPSKPWKHLALYEGKKRSYLVSYHPAFFLRKGAIEEFISGVGLTLKKTFDALTTLPGGGPA